MKVKVKEKDKQEAGGSIRNRPSISFGGRGRRGIGWPITVDPTR